MKKQLSRFVGAAIMLTAAAAWGQVSHQLQVTVPFSFMAGGTSSPAGDYKVEIDPSSHLIALSSAKFKAFMLTTTALEAGGSRSYLRFHRYGDEWFLQTVTFNGTAQNLPVSKRQREMMIAKKSSGEEPLMAVADIAVH